MKIIKEVIVVEGRNDAKQVVKAVRADTIETRGSAIPKETLSIIEKMAEKRGIIIFTDPDFSGEKIRKIVTAAVPNAKHAFLTKSDGIPSKAGGSLGVEHASPDAILKSLSHVYTKVSSQVESISQEDLITNGLIGGEVAKDRRKAIGEILHIGYVNGKQLKHRLKMFQIKFNDFQDAVTKINKRG